MNGDRLARISLRIDAVYCLVIGALVAIVSPFAGSLVGLPIILLVGIGMATSGWGVYVWLLVMRHPIRTSARFVMSANIAVTCLLAVTGLVAGTTVLALGAFVLAVDVAAFAVSQGVALRRMRIAN